MYKQGGKEPKEGASKQSCRINSNPSTSDSTGAGSLTRDLQAKLSLASEGTAPGGGFWLSGSQGSCCRGRRAAVPGDQRPLGGLVRASGGAELARGRAGQQCCGRLLAWAALLPLTYVLCSRHLTFCLDKRCSGPDRCLALAHAHAHTRRSQASDRGSGLLSAGEAAELPPSGCATRAPAFRVTSFLALPPEAPPTPCGKGVTRALTSRRWVHYRS